MSSITQQRKLEQSVYSARPELLIHLAEREEALGRTLVFGGRVYTAADLRATHTPTWPLPPWEKAAWEEQRTRRVIKPASADAGAGEASGRGPAGPRNRFAGIAGRATVRS